MLEANALRKSYGKVVALDGVSMHACEGETVGLLGPNGAGSPDISTTGAFINTPHAFHKGTKLKLRFELPGTGTRIQAVGEVRYSLQGVALAWN